MEKWEKELGEYIDKVFKPKSPTMGGLDRESILNFVRNLLAKERKKAFDQGGQTVGGTGREMYLRGRAVVFVEIAQKLKEIEQWTLKYPDSFGMEGRTMQLVEVDDVLALLSDQQKDI